MANNSPKKEFSEDYLEYVQHGESFCVYITRDICKNVNTKGMWTDVLNTKSKGYYLKNADGYWDFEYFDVELFPRKIKPKYDKYMTQEEKDYETWATATSDIRMQRKQGYKGKKYRIYPKIVYDGVEQDRWGYSQKKYRYTISKVERI